MTEIQSKTIYYREANVSDCDAIANVHVQSWIESYAGIVPQSFLDNLSIEKRAKMFKTAFTISPYKIYVAESTEHGVIGFANIGKPRENVDGYDFELYAIYLLKEFQGKGIGRELFKCCVNYLKSIHGQSMYLLALEASPYKSFYDNLGGQVIEKRQKEIEEVLFNVLIYGWDSFDDF